MHEVLLRKKNESKWRGWGGGGGLGKERERETAGDVMQLNTRC